MSDKVRFLLPENRRGDAIVIAGLFAFDRDGACEVPAKDAEKAQRVMRYYGALPESEMQDAEESKPKRRGRPPKAVE
jgi:hypothetical protein